MRIAHLGPEQSVPEAGIWRCGARVDLEMLRERTRDTLQYISLKHLHLYGNLVDDTDTSAWQVKTPNRGW